MQAGARCCHDSGFPSVILEAVFSPPSPSEGQGQPEIQAVQDRTGRYFSSGYCVLCLFVCLSTLLFDPTGAVISQGRKRWKCSRGGGRLQARQESPCPSGLGVSLKLRDPDAAALVGRERAVMGHHPHSRAQPLLALTAPGSKCPRRAGRTALATAPSPVGRGTPPAADPACFCSHVPFAQATWELKGLAMSP